jgi:hypothetical protein
MSGSKFRTLVQLLHLGPGQYPVRHPESGAATL